MFDGRPFVSLNLKHLADTRSIAFTIEGRGVRITQAGRSHVQRTVSMSIGRFIRHIRSIVVLLEDVNGPRGGIDKRCRLDLRLRPSGRLSSSANSTDIGVAVMKAARRARALLQRRRQRARAGRRATSGQNL